jgi:hypothetical protein
MGYSNNYSCIESPNCLRPVVKPPSFTEPATSILFTNSNTGESCILDRYSQGDQSRTVMSLCHGSKDIRFRAQLLDYSSPLFVG